MGYSTTTSIVSQHPPSHDAEYECSLEAIFGTPEYTSRRSSGSGSGSNTTGRWGNGSNANNDLLPSASASSSSSSHSFDSSTVSLKWEDSVDSFCSFEETDDEEEPELVYHQRKSRYQAPAATTKQVQFDCVQIREYALTVGDHPWCPSCPLSLSWEHTASRRVNLDAFEFDKRNRREAEQLFRQQEEEADGSDCDYPRELTLRQRRQRLATVLGSRRLAQQLEVRAARKSVLEELKQFLLILDDDDEEEEDEEDEHDTIIVQAQEQDWWMQRERGSASSTVVTTTTRPLYRSAGANEIAEPHRDTRKSQEEEGVEESCFSHDECASLVEASSKEAKEHSYKYNNASSKQSGNTTLMSVFGGMMSRSPFRRSRRHQGYQQLLAEQ